jgi:ABC-type sugar transport system ATPase subunit
MSTGDALVLQASKLSDGSTDYILNPVKSSAHSITSGHIVIRPEEIKLNKSVTSGSINGLITKIDYYGHDAMVAIDVADQHLQVRIPGPFDFNVGQSVALEHVGPVRFFANN